MFIFEILIYVFFAYVMCTYAMKSYAYSQRTGIVDKPDHNLWMFWLFFALICGIRWNVGNDSVGYMIDFNEGRIRENSVEHLWDLLVLGIHGLHLHYTIGMAITGFVQIYFVTKLTSKYRYILLFLPIVLFGTNHFLDWCNAVRQMMAASIFVFSTQFILKRKILPYMLCIFAASQIHHSAQMLYVMYLFAYIRPDKISISGRRVLTIGIFITCFVLGMTPQFQSFIGLFTLIIQSVGDYDHVESFVQQTLGENNLTERAFGPIQLSFFLTNLAPIWFGPELKRKFKETIPYYELWWFFSFIYSCGYFLVCNVNFMFIRPFLYLYPFQLLIVSLLLYHFYSKKNIIMLCSLIGIIWVSVAWNIMKNIGNPIESVTYKLFLFHNFDEWSKLI